MEQTVAFIISVALIIVFFYMASKLSDIARNLKTLNKEVAQMRQTMKYYALKDGVMNDEGRFIKRIKKPTSE